jgi:hypothetical protein
MNPNRHLLIISVLLTILCGCNQQGNKQYTPESAGETGMEEGSVATSPELGNNENPLYGLVYRDIEETRD